MVGCGIALVNPPVGLLRVHSLGVPRLWCDGRSLVLRGRPLALLWYLIYTAQAHSREHVVDLLWPHLAPEQARQSLRQALYQLRCVLGGAASGLQSSRESVAWVGPCVCDTDVWLHATPVAQVQAVCGQVRGIFLAGVTVAHAPDFEDWLIGQRWYWQSQQRRGLLRAVCAWQQVGDLQPAVQALAQHLADDVSDEEALQHYLPLLHAQAGVIAVQHAYQYWQQRLATQWQLVPTLASVQLYQRLLTESDAVGTAAVKSLWRSWCHARCAQEWYARANSLSAIAPSHVLALYAQAVCQTWQRGYLAARPLWQQWQPMASSWVQAGVFHQYLAQVLCEDVSLPLVDKLDPTPVVLEDWWCGQVMVVAALFREDASALKHIARAQIVLAEASGQQWAEQCSWWNWGLALERQSPGSGAAYWATWWLNEGPWAPLYGWWYVRLLQQQCSPSTLAVWRRTLVLAEAWKMFVLLPPLYRLGAEIFTTFAVPDAAGAAYFARVWAEDLYCLPAD